MISIRDTKFDSNVLISHAMISVRDTKFYSVVLVSYISLCVLYSVRIRSEAVFQNIEKF